MVRFPLAEVWGFEISAQQAKRAFHIAILQYQLELIEDGKTPSKTHPFLELLLKQLDKA